MAIFWGPAFPASATQGGHNDVIWMKVNKTVFVNLALYSWRFYTVTVEGARDRGGVSEPSELRGFTTGFSMPKSRTN